MATTNLFNKIRSEPPKPIEDQSEVLTSPKDNVSCKSDRSSGSPEPTCAICLGKLENKSFTDSCFHQFCFTCLLEWSKVKAECPLCKQAFKSIIHNVRSIEDYDQYHLRPDESRHRGAWESPEGRRFRYRSTLTSERRRELAIERLLFGHVSSQRRLLNFRHIGVTSEFRRSVYELDRWARPVEQTGVTRVRDISAQFFHANPACTHRLIPWLNRELVVLLHDHESRIAFVLELILSLIQRYNILSPEFREHVRPYLLARTEHFIHEFHNFARSPWDMLTYDQRAVYPDLEVFRQSPDSSDSDVMIVSPPPGEPQTATAAATTASSTRRRVRNGATSSERNATASTSAPSDSHNPEPPNSLTALDRVKTFLSNVGSEGWDSPLSSHAPSWDSPQRTLASTAVEVPLPSSSSPQPGPSGISQFRAPRDYLSDSDSSGLLAAPLSQTPRNMFKALKGENEEDCQIVACVKPSKDRPAVVIDLVSSDSEPEALSVMHVKDEQPETGSQRARRLRSYYEMSSSSDSSFISNNNNMLVSPLHSKSSSSHPRTWDLDEHSSSHRSVQEDSARSQSSHNGSPSERWRWTAYEGGGGKLQRSYSRSSSATKVLPQWDGVQQSSPPSPLERLPTRLSSVVGEVLGVHKKQHRKHKKHKHKHKSHHHHHESKKRFKKHCKGHKSSSKTSNS